MAWLGLAGAGWNVSDQRATKANIKHHDTIVVSRVPPLQPMPPDVKDRSVQNVLGGNCEGDPDRAF